MRTRLMKSPVRLPQGVSLTPTGLQFNEDLSFESWESIGTRLRSVEKSVLWWIGDWVNFGERKYGEKYSEALEATEYSYETLRAAGWVAGQIETVRRRTNVCWS